MDLVRLLSMADTPFGLSIIVVAGIITWIAYFYSRQRHTPPGLYRLPLLGNILQVPRHLQFIPFTDWSQNYGPIFSLDLLGREIVIINTFKAAGELLDKCSNIYNSRPYSVMASEVLCGGTFMPLEVDMDRWRRWRRASHATFGPNGVKNSDCQRATKKAAVLATLRTLVEPDKWEHNLDVFAASGIFNAVYGWAPLDADSPHIEATYELATRISDAVVPGAYFVDIFPFMKYLPEWIAGWKRDGMSCQTRLSERFEALLSDVAEKMSTDSAPASYASELLRNKNRHGFMRKECAWIAGVMVSAGAETTSTTMVNFVLAMLNYPDVMRKAQSELDAVIGRDRVPTLEDADNLPYIRAVVRETLRWRPPSTLGVPHLSTEDNWYDGYLIRKGAIVFGNIWAMNRDPSIYPDFDVFRPERFLSVDGKVEIIPPGTRKLGHASFGFGRRVCIGMHFAEQALFMGIATMLWALDIKPDLDGRGKEIIPPTDQWVNAGTVVRPAPFQCRFSPRFPMSQGLLSALSSDL
ncbi:cytochrome P450 [Irpex lacteus]|nr:cytochrome P450 [Irpex lacteus]